MCWISLYPFFMRDVSSVTILKMVGYGNALVSREEYTYSIALAPHDPHITVTAESDAALNPVEVNVP